MPDVTGPRRQQAEERREQILDAACRVFAEKGFAGTSIRDIAREIGVTEGLLYHYFENKEQLMHACWKERSWRANLERILSGAEGMAVAEVLSALVSDFLQTLYENAPQVRVAAAEMQYNSEMAAFYLHKIQDNHLLIVDFLRARQAAGEIRAGADVDTAGGLLMGCAYSLFLLYNRQEPDAWNRLVEGFARSGVEVIMRGIAP